MEVDSETHGQTLDRTWGVLLRSGRRNLGSLKDQGFAEKLTEMASLAHGNAQSLKQLPGSLHGDDLGPLHMCQGCVAGSICGTPGGRNRAVPML